MWRMINNKRGKFMQISSINYVVNFGTSNTNNSKKFKKYNKNISDKNLNACRKDAVLGDNKTDISSIHGRHSGLNMNNSVTNLTDFIKLHNINKQSLKIYKKCVSEAKKEEPRVYALLCKYRPSIEETSFKISHNPYANFKEYINQIIALHDAQESIRGTFEVLYDLNGKLIDTEIDLQDLK